MKEIVLSQGKTALIDDEDFDRVGALGWWYDKSKKQNTGYAVGYVGKANTKAKTMMAMHRFIVNAPKGSLVDHIDRNELNNQKSSLRVTDRRGNNRNSAPYKINSSGLKGVFWDESKSKWLAQLHTTERFYHLGRYKDKKRAALAYDVAANEIFKDFAYLNFPEELSEANRYVPTKPAPSSTTKGVSWNKRKQRWIVRIGTGKNRKSIGSYLSEETAISALKSKLEESLEIDDLV